LIRVQKRGEPHSPNEADERQAQANDNTPFDEKAWRRKYMRNYMREWRRRVKALKDGDG
jgi:hypothetical protein